MSYPLPHQPGYPQQGMNYQPTQQQPCYQPTQRQPYYHPTQQQPYYQPTQQQSYYQPTQQQPYYQPTQQQPYYRSTQTQPNVRYYPQGTVQMGLGQEILSAIFGTKTQPEVLSLSSLPLREKPTYVLCTFCNCVVKTKIKRKIGSTTYICCGLMSLVGCCLFAFCMDCTRDGEHQCPNCKSKLGLFKQPVVDCTSGSDSGTRRSYGGGGRGGGGFGGGGDGGGDGGGGDGGGGGGGGGDGGGGG